MAFERIRLPDPMNYYEGEGLRLVGNGKWKSTLCVFHEERTPSLRINVASGAWCCMGCGARGGDVLAFHMQRHGIEFVEACRALGAWVNDGRPVKPQKPAPLPPRAALQVIGFEATLAAVAAGNVAHGVTLTEPDRFRLLTAAARINRLVEAYA